MPDSLVQPSPAGKSAAADFSLFSGGPLYRIALRLGLVRGEESLVRLGVAITFVTWVPILVLTLAHQFSSGGVAIAFALSLGTHVRFLLAIPFFFVVEAWAGPRLRSFVVNLVETGIVPPEETGALHAAQKAATRRRDSIVAEALLVVLTIVTITAGVRTDVAGTVSSWRMAGDAYTSAGWWYAVVAMPVFQFLCWRWAWRFIIWTAFLGRVSRLNLRLIPTHPDLCGGLGYLAIAQSYLSAISIALSGVLAASIGEQILDTGVRPSSFLPIILTVTGMTLLFFLGPLLFFSMLMFEVKRRGYREYGVLASSYTRMFDEKWVHGTVKPAERLLGTGDIQSLADLANGFNVVRNMRIVPFGFGIVANIVAFAAGPMVPLLLFEFSIDELIMKIAKLLLGM